MPADCPVNIAARAFHDSCGFAPPLALRLAATEGTPTSVEGLPA
jgi:hypothetical protein